MNKYSHVTNGSYHRYYEFRSGDSRSAILREQLEALWTDEPYKTEKDRTVHILDIGCNSGNFTAKVQQILEEVNGSRRVRATGLDIDVALCERASTDFPNIHFLCGNVLHMAMHEEPDESDPVEQHMVHLGIEQFDVICCFSVLMYVHLNGGDEGVRRVLDYLCRKGKFLILELQAWKKYRDQVRRLKRDAGQAYPHYSKLEWKENDLENHIKTYVQANGFELLAESAAKTEFDRPIIFFRKINVKKM